VSSLNLHDPAVKITDAAVALGYLKEGNKRFVNDAPMTRDTNRADLATTATGQKPFAAILACADSRSTPEIFFDQKIGDIFVVRNAGNVADQSALGSLEFATKHLGAAIVVVVGHTVCGAVYNAHDAATGLSDNLQAVLDCIKVNVKDAATKEDAVLAQIHAQVDILKNNPVIKETNTPVYGAIYDLASGEVKFL